jgi:Uncharacterised nucleotidyltransferase
VNAENHRVSANGDPVISPEAELVLSLCRPRPVPAQLLRATELLAQDLDWGRVIDHAQRHRVTPAVWANVLRLGARDVVQMHRHLFRAMVLYNSLRSEAFQREFREVRSVLAENGLLALVRKGIYLASAVYPDPSLRYMSDIDLLIRRSDAENFKGPLQRLGYQQGKVVNNDRVIEPIRREVEAFWLINASSLPAFQRPTSDPCIQLFRIDLRYHILEPSMGNRFEIDEWFARSREEWLFGAFTHMPSREDFFIDLCVHLYREAVTLSGIEASKDICLSKFVDVAEVLASPHAAPDHARLTELADRYSLRREIYFALAQTAGLLPDSVDESLLQALDPGDRAYLDEFGTIDQRRGKWREPLLRRAFDYKRHKDAAQTLLPFS